MSSLAMFFNYAYSRRQGFLFCGAGFTPIKRAVGSSTNSLANIVPVGPSCLACWYYGMWGPMLAEFIDTFSPLAFYTVPFSSLKKKKASWERAPVSSVIVMVASEEQW